MSVEKNRMQEVVQAILDEAVATGAERGAQCAVYWNGELVVDAWSGILDAEGRRKVNGDSLFPVFSTGKAIASTAVHRLVEQGKIGYDTRVADVWPEFGCAGKEEIRLWHVMTHRTGLFEVPAYHSDEELTDWKLMCSRMAKMTPAWEPGSKTQYQSRTYSWLLGETASWADGRDFQTIIREEVMKPLGIEDSMFFGIPPEAEERVAWLTRGADLPVPAQGDVPLEQDMNKPIVHQACLPAFNGLMSARALAKHYAALIGDLEGHDALLKPETIRLASTLNRSPNDPAPLKPGTWELFGLGYVLYGPKHDYGQIFGHGGYGGAEGIVDVKNHLVVAYTKNIIHGEEHTRDKIYEAIGMKSRDW